jgi:thymidylate kinase
METLETQQKVRKVYLEFVENGELILIDGDKPKDEVADALYSEVLSLLKTVNYQ